jgi:hypothetical protein
MDEKNRDESEEKDEPTASNNCESSFSTNNLSSNTHVNHSPKVSSDQKQQISASNLNLDTEPNQQTHDHFNINEINPNISTDENDTISCDNNNIEECFTDQSIKKSCQDSDEEYYLEQNDLKKYKMNNLDDYVEYKLIERNGEDSNNGLLDDEFKSILYSFDSTMINRNEIDMSYDASKLVLTIDDDFNQGDERCKKKLNKSVNECNNLNNLQDDFIDEDFLPNQLNISNSCDEESNISNSTNINSNKYVEKEPVKPDNATCNNYNNEDSQKEENYSSNIFSILK